MIQVGDLVVIHKAPFNERNLFVYQNGDLGIIKMKPDHSNLYRACVVILLKDFNDYHIPISYMKKMEAPC